MLSHFFLLQIVDPNEFFNMWDHILINHPSFIYFLPLAACRLQRRFLVNLETHQELMVGYLSNNFCYRYY